MGVEDRGFYPHTWWAQLAVNEKRVRKSFVKDVSKIAITRSTVLAQNAPQTVWRPESA